MQLLVGEGGRGSCSGLVEASAASGRARGTPSSSLTPAGFARDAPNAPSLLRHSGSSCAGRSGSPRACAASGPFSSRGIFAHWWAPFCGALQPGCEFGGAPFSDGASIPG
jgi:hypothetical protein